MALICLLDICDPAASVLEHLSPTAADPFRVPCKIDCSTTCAVAPVYAVGLVRMVCAS